MFCCPCFPSSDNINQNECEAPVKTTEPPSMYKPSIMVNSIRYNSKFLPMAMAASLKVANRRRKNGPLYPGWSYKAEAFFEVLRVIVGSLKTLNLESFIAVRPTWSITMPSNQSRVKIFMELVQKSSDAPSAEDIIKEIKSGSPEHSEFPLEISKEIEEKLQAIKSEDDLMLCGEMTIPRVPNRQISPETGCCSSSGRASGNGSSIVYYLHGGAYVLCSAKMQRPITWRLSHYSGFNVFSLNYRMAPEYAFPSALEDAVQGYLYLLNVKGYNSENIHISGDSAGGGLSLALAFYLLDTNLPLPASICCFSPWLDLLCTKESWTLNKDADYLINPTDLGELSPSIIYGREFIKHPYVSPFYRENLKNLPPILIQCGTNEVLIDEIKDFYNRLNDQDPGRHNLELYDYVPHVFQMFPAFKESKIALKSAANYMKKISLPK